MIEIYEEISYLRDKQLYVQIEYLSRGFTQAHKGLKWIRRRKQHTLKNNFTERKHFIRRYQRNGWMDFIELRAIDSLCNEGTNILVMDSLGCKGWFVERGRMKDHH